MSVATVTGIVYGSVDCGSCFDDSVEIYVSCNTATDIDVDGGSCLANFKHGEPHAGAVS